MNKKVILLSAIALSMSISQATLACGDQQKYTVGDKFEKMTQKLDLTADQKSKIKAITAKTMEAMKPKFREMRDLHMQLNEMADSKDMDESKVDDLINQKKELMGAVMKMRVMTRHEINMLLTDKQKEKLAGMVAKWKARNMNKE